MTGEVLYFGCWGGTGHYLWRPDGTQGDPAQSRGLDGPYLPPCPRGCRLGCSDDDRCQPQGLARLAQEPGRTVLDFFDRTVDARGGSHSLFLLPPGTDFADAVRLARAAFPRVWHRLDAAGVAVRLAQRPRRGAHRHLHRGTAQGRGARGHPERLQRARAMPERSLAAILAESRKYQNEVSTKLAEQVLRALLDLLRGVKSADAQARGKILAGVTPDEIYGGLLTVILRLVFLLYAEERTLLPGDPVYQLGYSLASLFARLREDAAQHPDTMDQRYGAWAHLLSLFRLVYDGATHDACHLPARHGDLFDPDRYPFLEGRPPGDRRVVGEGLAGDVPQVSDGIIGKVLEGLLILEGERLSYRTLDVEQLGSVYEHMMGYAVVTVAGPSVALKPHHVLVDLADLLRQKPAERAKRVKELADCDLAPKEAEALRAAADVDQAVAALGRRVSPRTPAVLLAGALYLQPGEERRRSGSHYTPRTLTVPIVETTLRPVLEALGPRPTPAQILDLKLCDPAMGSGAFLVGACRYLAAILVTAWEHHGEIPTIPPDEEPVIHAQRLIAQRCLYGVDKNPFAVSLAKLSLWLVTLAKDHPFTFLDHALRHGDSLVGLTRGQIAAFRWDEEQDNGPLFGSLGQQVAAARAQRQAIYAVRDEDDEGKRAAWHKADAVLHEARLAGDLVLAAFFGADKDKAREEKRRTYENLLREVRAGTAAPDALHEAVAELRAGPRGVVPFHWQVEFPEVFERENPGFDAIVGNPPFLGGSKISSNFGGCYSAWVLNLHEGSHGNGDLVAHFFRRSYTVLRQNGTAGLIATNTIAQGDTRTTGLQWICRNGGEIYSAKKRVKWPGIAANVTVSIISLIKGNLTKKLSKNLNGQEAEAISCYLSPGSMNSDPYELSENKGLFSMGTKTSAQGFIFDDNDTDCTPLSIMSDIILRNPSSRERIAQYIIGSDLNEDPRHSSSRYVINFENLNLDQIGQWPELVDVVEKKVKPERMSGRLSSFPWWQFERGRFDFYRKIENLEAVLACSLHSKELAFVRIAPQGKIFSHAVGIIASSSQGLFAAVQSRVHETWARFFSSSIEDQLRYTPSDCFETFPFPKNWEQSPGLGSAGEAYYAYRAAMMIQKNQGLTATYNRFHDPNEQDPGILKLRALHEAMDRAVLDAYGWTDIPTACEFRLDYEEDEDDEAEATSGRRKKKPYRYRWPAEVHDEVLARLLDLNQKRAEEERLSGAAAEAAKKRTAPAKKAPAKASAKTRAPAKKKAAPEGPLSLFGDDKETE